MHTERAQEVKAEYEERLKGLAELTSAAQQSAQFVAYLKVAAKFHQYKPILKLHIPIHTKLRLKTIITNSLPSLPYQQAAE